MPDINQAASIDRRANPKTASAKIKKRIKLARRTLKTIEHQIWLIEGKVINSNVFWPNDAIWISLQIIHDRWDALLRRLHVNANLGDTAQSEPERILQNFADRIAALLDEVNRIQIAGQHLPSRGDLVNDDQVEVWKRGSGWQQFRRLVLLTAAKRSVQSKAHQSLSDVGQIKDLRKAMHRAQGFEAEEHCSI